MTWEDAWVAGMIITNLQIGDVVYYWKRKKGEKERRFSGRIREIDYEVGTAVVQVKSAELFLEPSNPRLETVEISRLKRGT